jgi:hypothetical protein
LFQEYDLADRRTTASGCQRLAIIRRSPSRNDQFLIRCVIEPFVMVQTISAAVACRSCGKDALYVGKLPAIGVHAAVHVFKCQTCMTVHSKPAKSAEAGVSRVFEGTSDC